MEASALSHASKGGLLGRRSPLLKLQGDEKLVALIREHNEHAFEVLFDRYHSRLLAFCRHMLRSQEDAEDVLQEVFVKAHAAMLADERAINARPWLYRIARNRCLNHLRRPVPEGQDTMDVMPAENGVTTADRVQRREDFRALVADVGELPETQRTALLLREIDALSYEEIAAAMDTTVPAVKSLLVRARMSLAEASQSRHLTCGEVRLELAEAAEGLRKASGPVRQHLKRCEQCDAYRSELRSSTKALAAIAPLGPLALFHNLIVNKVAALFGGSSTAASGSAAGTGAAGTAVAGGGAAAAGGTAAAGAGAAAAGGGAAAFGGAAAAGAGGIGGALGAKAAATAATAALLTAGAVEVREIYSDKPVSEQRTEAQATAPPPAHGTGGLEAHKPAELHTSGAVVTTDIGKAPVAEQQANANSVPGEEEAAAPAAPADPAAAPPIQDTIEDAVVGPTAGDDGAAGNDDPAASGSGTGESLVAVVTPVPSTTPGAPTTEPGNAAPTAPPTTPGQAPPTPAPAPTPTPAPEPAPPAAPADGDAELTPIPEG
jgi:RNA polymerase sigma factor (sigma-70 family)